MIESRRSRLEELARRGTILEGIGNALGFSRERARQLLHKAGLHETWKEIRNEAKEKPRREEQEKKEILGALVSCLETRVSQLAKEKGWPYEKAVEHKKLHPKSRYSFDSLLRLFETYEEAKSDGRRTSLDKLGEISEIHFATVSNILESMKLETICRKYPKRITLAKEQAKTLERGFSLGMSAPDIAYFASVPHYVAKQRFTKIGKRNNVRPLKSFPQYKRLTYRLTSQIYEAQDLGFNVEETFQLFDTTEEVVNHAIEKRKRIEPKIKSALRILYKRKFDRPYLDAKPMAR